ncbi:MAG: chemotaxis protein CheW [Candidatus Brocadiaceae bacterium]
MKRIPASERCFIILPMTLATFFGVLVQVEEQAFVIPTINVEQVVRVREDEIKTVENRETIQIDGRIVSLARLSAVLEFFHGKRKKRRIQGILLQ